MLGYVGMRNVELVIPVMRWIRVGVQVHLVT